MDEIKQMKKIFIWFLMVMFVVMLIIFISYSTVNTVKTGIVRYEQYTEIFQTCEKLNTDLCNMKDLPENNKMFEQFSKQQRILTIKTQLNRWVEEYNAKSKMINRSFWKSSELPYQLNVDQFKCY